MKKSLQITPSFQINCLVLAIASVALGSVTEQTLGQSSRTFQNGSGLLFNSLPRTNFEPRLRTNFEASTRLDSGVRFNKGLSATALRLNRLLTRLKAQLPEERKFIQDLIKLVETKKIPEVLVNESFFFTLRRFKGKFPFPYFEHVIRLQAGRLKFPVPDFDRKIYSRPNFRPQTFVQ